MSQTPTVNTHLSHEERTATEPRAEGLHAVSIDEIRSINEKIRTFKLAIKDKQGIDFHAGQWLDVHVPGLEKAGGFTIPSSPRHANLRATNRAKGKPFLELAIQKSPDNPPAAWLWQSEEKILKKELNVRVGGSFIWPPPEIDLSSVSRVVLVAGGVGINPLISIFSHLREEHANLEIHFLYSTKLPRGNPNPAEILFLPRILHLLESSSEARIRLDLFFTGSDTGLVLSLGEEFVKSQSHGNVIRAFTHRIDESALSTAVGGIEDRDSTVFYVCGPPVMTDETVEFLRSQDNVTREQVLCEKWW